MSVGIVYDGSIRDNGTPFYVRLTLAKIFGENVPWYTEAVDFKSEADFLIHVDDGRDDLPLDNIPHPWGYWIVDSHLGPEIRTHKARKADLVWCAQKPYVEVLRNQGIEASWLPLACEPLCHPTASEMGSHIITEMAWRALGMEVKDLVFVGHVQDPKSSSRLDLLDRLFRFFPESWLAFGYFHEEMAALYHKARIGINHAVRNDLNMRFFELASIGVPQLAPRKMVGLTELGFRAGIHYIGYNAAEDAVECVRDFLRRPELLAQMAQEAHSLVRSEHTYEHRVRQMLADAEQGGYL